MHRGPTAILLAVAALAALAAPTAAPAAKKREAKRPEITRVTPMRLRVGATLTVRGRNFSARRTRNTVVFRSPKGRSVFAKPRRATRRKLVVRVPSTIAKLLGRKATRFKIRVLAGRFSAFTSKRLSPVVLPIGFDNGGPGSPGGSSSCGEADTDGDLLPDAVEGRIGTDPCLADTDLDGVEDGYEEQSAIDLNHYPSSAPLPYPGKRPYPNALDSGDAGTDYDGDGVTLYEEFRLWLRYSADDVPRSGRPQSLSNLAYSDGLQRSRTVAAPSVGLPGGPLRNWALDADEDGMLSDDERDGDGDGLANWDEGHGRGTEDWWPATHDGKIEPRESRYPIINFLDNPDLPGRDAASQPDMDGDGLEDGADDSDHDGLTNQFEVRRPSNWLTVAFGANPWAYVNPFNPCKPFRSERCHAHPPFGYYDNDEVPPVGPPPPAGFPGAHPATPAG